jgi:hypothetical protein
LARHAEAIIAQCQPSYLIELGSGSSRKTRHLLDACERLGHHKVGYLWWDAESSVAGVSAGEDGSDVFFGLGTGFALTETFDLRLEYELYQLDDADAHSVFLSAQTSF